MKNAHKLQKALTEIDQALKNFDHENVTRLSRATLKQFPNHPLLLGCLAKSSHEQGEAKEALKFAEQAMTHGGIKWLPVVSTHLEILEADKNWDAMVDLAEKSLNQGNDPRKSKWLLARTLVKADRRKEALALFEQLLAEKPEANLLNDCCHCLFDMGYQEAGLLQNQLAAALEPNSLVIRSNIILMAHYIPGMTNEKLLPLHKDYFESCARQYGQVRQFTRSPLENRNLRIGFISNGFWSHPAGWLSIGAIMMLAEHFPCDIFLYNSHPPKPKDAVANRFRQIPSTQCSVYKWPVEKIHEKLLADELDVLVDMSGHSADSALPAFAARSAPVQVKWIGGLSNTSATPNMDYLLSDWVETPEGAEATFTESLVRLPGGYVSYAPPRYMPNINRLPALDNGYLTFACFNNVHKINPTIIEVWSRILKALPSSRLILKGKQFNDVGVRNGMYAAFKNEGVSSEQLQLEGPSTHDQLLKTYQKVDIALDPWPYTGGLTTIEALYVGVPTVTYPGPHFAGRHAASHLTNVGLEDWIAKDFDHYVEIVKDWASKLEDLDNLRFGLRKRCEDSPLGDHLQFAANLYQAFTIMFQQWEQGKTPSSINFSGFAEIPCSVIEKLKTKNEDPHKEQNNEGLAPEKITGITEQDLLSHMPENEQKKLISLLKNSKSFLEYGAGGSTLLSMREEVKNIITVESDASFMSAVEEISKSYKKNSTEHHVHLIDIGKTGAWSFPINNEKISNWHEYAQKPWERIINNNKHPDLILIDGRFRVACFLACYIFSKSGTKILFDDYTNRTHYHICEKYLPIKSRHGRMALFVVEEKTKINAAIMDYVKYCLIPS
ncbi:hypothetical protein [Ectothiorhodospira lacustris]|uniref:O-linked N-acetylglucosamine transferase, SPINDLY family protein n=1 Tax=Ectothiorhodospira lacustris TaxID=2899127 RepID=UPI001EE98F65|nr:hypothetical protein [Ectothiorhodospira lacustris]MCG5510200.1 hypothetical protein [Ectothiorhodospira lacustris]MCG5522043.1 hypothetical protein [Ectothiorhodospira lacustris]